MFYIKLKNPKTSLVVLPAMMSCFLTLLLRRAWVVVESFQVVDGVDAVFAINGVDFLSAAESSDLSAI